MPDRHINDFLETRNGTIWIATDGGLARLNPTGLAGSKENPLFITFLPDNLRAKKISVLFEDKSGTVFIGTGDGLYKLNEQDELEAINLGKPPSNANSSDRLLPSIAEISRESISAMSDIVWAINPKKDSLDDLIFRMQRHARETLEQRDIQLEFSSPGGIRELRMTTGSRRNIYLIFKEILNNIVRHSDAKNVNITVEFVDTKLTLTVSDDGRGFDMNADHEGIGLANMKKRAADFGGRLDIRSINGEGTFFKLQVARY